MRYTTVLHLRKSRLHSPKEEETKTYIVPPKANMAMCLDYRRASGGIFRGVRREDKTRDKPVSQSSCRHAVRARCSVRG